MVVASSVSVSMQSPQIEAGSSDNSTVVLTCQESRASRPVQRERQPSRRVSLDRFAGPVATLEGPDIEAHEPAGSGPLRAVMAEGTPARHRRTDPCHVT
jgi:hypothetical protein